MDLSTTDLCDLRVTSKSAVETSLDMEFASWSIPRFGTALGLLCFVFSQIRCAV